MSVVSNTSDVKRPDVPLEHDVFPHLRPRAATEASDSRALFGD